MTGDPLQSPPGPAGDVEVTDRSGVVRSEVEPEAQISKLLAPRMSAARYSAFDW